MWCSSVLLAPAVFEFLYPVVYPPQCCGACCHVVLFSVVVSTAVLCSSALWWNLLWGALRCRVFVFLPCLVVESAVGCPEVPGLLPKCLNSKTLGQPSGLSLNHLDCNTNIYCYYINDDGYDHCLVHISKISEM